MRKTINNSLVILSIAAIFGNPFSVLAATTSATDLQRSIDAKNAEIQALSAQVNAYQAQVDSIDGQAQTLQSTLNGIAKNQQKLKTNLNLTGKKIDRTALTIQENQNQIGDLGQGIERNASALSETVRSVYENDQKTLLGLMLTNSSVSDFLRDFDDLSQVQSKLKNQVVSMQDAKSSLEQSQVALAQKKSELQNLKGDLVDQKQVIDAQATEKATLLAQTKDQESQYQKLLSDTKARVAELNKELFDYESQLKFTINPNSLPAAGSSPLSWPLANPVVTQRFGKTVDAKRLYVSGSHSGVDFRASVGTAVYAAADGTVEGTGNTDLTCYKASFGKWVFIRHTNGLATAYGHLSVIKAATGQIVKAGDLIGYSGQTGHATGPHLHLTVYAANGVNGEKGARVDTVASNGCKGKNYTMPIAPTNAYLDPLLYLPHATNSMFKDGGGDSGE
ncbi:MAG: peptidase M23b [Patescibacteria group bacterium]|nr:peptidase M23b [Patescibacteria group bacterium]